MTLVAQTTRMASANINLPRSCYQRGNILAWGNSLKLAKPVPTGPHLNLVAVDGGKVVEFDDVVVGRRHGSNQRLVQRRHLQVTMEY